MYWKGAIQFCMLSAGRVYSTLISAEDSENVSSPERRAEKIPGRKLLSAVNQGLKYKPAWQAQRHYCQYVKIYLKYCLQLQREQTDGGWVSFKPASFQSARDSYLWLTDYPRYEFQALKGHIKGSKKTLTIRWFVCGLAREMAKNTQSWVFN